jgi:arginyl-tRNA synthetase
MFLTKLMKIAPVVLAERLIECMHSHADRVLYIVDERQALHFQQIFSLPYKTSFALPTMQLEHISFGMALDKTSKPYKSRDGGVTKLADLLDKTETRAKSLIASKQTAT